VWETLYPPHQAVASREAYVNCEGLIPWPGAVALSVRVLRVFRQRISVADVSRKLETEAVRVHATAYVSGVPLPFVVTKTYHALRVQGRWTWILSPQQYANYSAGTCPYA
jgi:hypothetical protein